MRKLSFLGFNTKKKVSTAKAPYYVIPLRQVLVEEHDCESNDKLAENLNEISMCKLQFERNLFVDLLGIVCRVEVDLQGILTSHGL